MGGFIFSLRTFIDPLSQVAQNNLFPDERQPEAKPWVFTWNTPIHPNRQSTVVAETGKTLNTAPPCEYDLISKTQIKLEREQLIGEGD